jgi:hypothetical protein
LKKKEKEGLKIQGLLKRLNRGIKTERREKAER